MLWFRRTAIVAMLFAILIFSLGHFSSDRLPPPILGDPDGMRLTEITTDGHLVYEDIGGNLVGTTNPEFRLPDLDELLRRGRRYRQPVTSLLGQIEDGLRSALHSFVNGARLLLGRTKRDPGGIRLVAVDEKSRTFNYYFGTVLKLARRNKSANADHPGLPSKTPPKDDRSHQRAQTAARKEWSTLARLRLPHHSSRARLEEGSCRLPGISDKASAHVIYAEGGRWRPEPDRASPYGTSEIVLKDISTPVVLYLHSEVRFVWSIQAGDTKIEGLVLLGSKDVGVEGIGPDVPVVYLGSQRDPAQALQRTCRKTLDLQIAAGKGLFPSDNAHGKISALRAMSVIIEETSGAALGTMRSGGRGIRYVIDQNTIASQEKSRRSAEAYLESLPPMPVGRLPDGMPILKMSDKPEGITPLEFLLQSGYLRRLTRREVDLVLADLAAQRAVLGEIDTNESLAAIRFAESFAILGPIDLTYRRRIDFNRGFLLLPDDVPLPIKKSYGLTTVIQYGRPSCLQGEGWNSKATWCLVRK